MEDTHIKAIQNENSGINNLELFELKSMIQALNQKFDDLKNEIKLLNLKQDIVIQGNDRVIMSIDLLKSTFVNLINNNDNLSDRKDNLKSINDNLTIRNDNVLYTNDIIKNYNDVLKNTNDIQSNRYDNLNNTNDLQKYISDIVNNDSDSVTLKNDKKEDFINLKSNIFDILKRSKLKKFYADAHVHRITKLFLMYRDKEKFSTKELQETFKLSKVQVSREMNFLKKVGWIKSTGGRDKFYFLLTEAGKEILTDSVSSSETG